MPTHYIPGRPEADEYAPWAANYVRMVETDDVIGVLQRQLEELPALLAKLDGAFRYAPGKWTVGEVAGHINDAERIFAYRALSVARGEQAQLPAFEQDDYMAKADFAERSLDDLAEEFQAIRRSSICLVRSSKPEVWSRRGNVAGFSVTVRGLIFVMAGHINHHNQILREQYAGARRG